MFLHYLNDQQKRAFFDLGYQMIHADHLVTDAEICYRDLLAHESRLTDINAKAVTNLEGHLDLFTDRQSCTALIIELLVLAIVDGSYHPEEDDLAQSAITYFGFTEADQDHINRMAEQIAASVTGFWDLVQTPNAT